VIYRKGFAVPHVARDQPETCGERPYGEKAAHSFYAELQGDACTHWVRQYLCG